MATRDEIADALAGMTLFADLAAPQLQGVAGRFEEAFFAEGARVLRQGLSGSAFYVILDGEAAILVDGEQRATLGRGEFFGEVSIILGELPTADVVALRPLRCVVLPGAAVEGFLIEHPKVMYRMLQAQSQAPSQREPRAELSTMADPERPYPPGAYPVIVIGSGPGGLQVAHELDQRGIGHAVLSADPGPGGMFRRWPFFQRLLSWTKPYAIRNQGSRDFERWDWNSLLATEPELRGAPGRVHGRVVRLPVPARDGSRA